MMDAAYGIALKQTANNRKLDKLLSRFNLNEDGLRRNVAEALGAGFPAACDIGSCLQPWR